VYKTAIVSTATMLARHGINPTAVSTNKYSATVGKIGRPRGCIAYTRAVIPPSSRALEIDCCRSNRTKAATHNAYAGMIAFSDHARLD
jgi:hypothetical protein